MSKNNLKDSLNKLSNKSTRELVQKYVRYVLANHSSTNIVIHVVGNPRPLLDSGSQVFIEINEATDCIIVSWFKDNKLHKEDGPARFPLTNWQISYILEDGNPYDRGEYFLNGSLKYSYECKQFTVTSELAKMRNISYMFYEEQ